MPKNNKVVKRDGRVFKERVPSKFRIGNRKSTKSANGMSTQALKDELNNPNHKKARNKIIAVLRNRGVEIDWPQKLVSVNNDHLTDPA